MIYQSLQYQNRPDYLLKYSFNFFFLFPNIRIKTFLRKNGLRNYYKIREKKTGNVISSTISVRQSAERIEYPKTALNEDPIKKDDHKHSAKINENVRKSQNNEFSFEEAKDCPNFDSFETEHFLAEIIKVA